jgi:HPt (histidine-containing phosphotransfer) domain-containing protein
VNGAERVSERQRQVEDELREIWKSLERLLARVEKLERDNSEVEPDGD